jgi:hypothetical protein
MKLTILIAALLFCLSGYCQLCDGGNTLLPDGINISTAIKKDADKKNNKDKIKLPTDNRWRFNSNKLWTGGLVMLAGAAKGFNETLEFNWHGFAAVFPKANPNWFWPQKSYLNKYKNRDQTQGPKFPGSTSLLVFTTDQYHLNNFVQKASMTAAIVIKIGEGKRPFKQYVFDALYYTACYQVGFGGVYYYFKSRVL